MNAPAHFHVLSLATLAPSPTNPRKHFDEQALQDLAETIKDHGVIEPIVVRLWPDDYETPEGREDRPLYEIVAGERRYRASLLASLADIPAMVRTLTTRQVLEIQVIENLQRKDVNEIEEAEGYQLMMRDFGYTADELAEKVGKSRAYIYGRLKLCALCDDARQAFREGKLDASRALLIARIPGAGRQREALKEITEGWSGPMSYRQAANIIQGRYMLKLKDASFDIKDALLLIEPGACTTCPKNTANARELFGDVDTDVCTDPDCWANKKGRAQEKAVELAQLGGNRVIAGKEAEKIMPHGRHNMKGYIDLDARNYDAEWREGGYPTHREVLKGQSLNITLIRDPYSGDLVETIEAAEFSAALRAAGLRDRTAEQKKKDEASKTKLRKESDYRRALFDGIRRETRLMLNGSTRPALQRPEDLGLVARQFWARTGFDAQVRLAKLYIQPGEKLDNHDRVRALNEELDTFNAAQLIQFLIDVSLVGTLDIPGYVSDITTPRPLVATAESFGLDVEAIRKEVTSGKPPKAKQTPPTAAAKAAEEPSTPTPAPRGSEGHAAAGKVAYRHPTNAELTWSGRGQKPEWVANYLATGGRLEELSTANQAARARGEKTGKEEIQAAGAARKPKEKAKSSGRASPAGGKAASAEDAPPARCDKTIDLIDTVFPELKVSPPVTAQGAPA